MNSRAQAGLEYLMTYGWALIMVATVIGILVFLVGTPTQTGFDCKSSDPAKIDFAGAQFGPMQVSSDAKYWSDGKIVLRNLTAGNIQIISLKKDAYFFLGPTIMSQENPTGLNCDDINDPNPVPALIASGEIFSIENNFVMYSPSLTVAFSCDFAPPYTYNLESGNIYLTYLDQTGLSHDLTLSCTNFPLT